MLKFVTFAVKNKKMWLKRALEYSKINKNNLSKINVTNCFQSKFSKIGVRDYAIYTDLLELSMQL